MTTETKKDDDLPHVANYHEALALLQNPGDACRVGKTGLAVLGEPERYFIPLNNPPAE